MDIEQARTNMIKQQIHTWNVLNEDILTTITNTPREAFVPVRYRDLAFSDTFIPLGHGQQMLAPKEEARMLQELNIKKSDIVLEVGTGSGYTTALFSKLVEHVFSVDIVADFTNEASILLNRYTTQNVTLITADAANSWSEQGPYDVIAITGSLPTLPEKFKEDLKIGGRLFCILGTGHVMTANIITRTERHEWAITSLFETMTPALLNSETTTKFKF